MFETLFRYPAVVARHQNGPFAEARERFLSHCYEQGMAHATLQRRAQELLVIAERIDITVGEEIKPSVIEACRSSKCRRHSELMTFVTLIMQVWRISRLRSNSWLVSCWR